MSPDQSTEALARARARRRGAILGALVGSAFAGTINLIFYGAAAFLWLGVPAAMALGWALGPAAASEEPHISLVMAILCTAAGALLTGMLLAATLTPYYPWSSGAERLAGIIGSGAFYGLIGIILFGAQSTLILWGVAQVWVLLVRRVVGGRKRAGMQEAPA